MTNQNLKEMTPFLMVRDIRRSLEFYVKGLGFQMIRTWEPAGQLKWCWLQRETVSLMLQEHGENDARYTQAAKGVGVALCILCADALALYKEFLENGLQPKEPFVGNGLWDMALTDPDGYNIHFESVTDVPEETTYTEWLSAGAGTGKK